MVDFVLAMADTDADADALVDALVDADALAGGSKAPGDSTTFSLDANTTANAFAGDLSSPKEDLAGLPLCHSDPAQRALPQYLQDCTPILPLAQSCRSQRHILG